MGGGGGGGERQTISTQGGVGCNLPVLMEGWEASCYYSRNGGRLLLRRKGWMCLYQKMLLIIGFFTGSDKLFFLRFLFTGSFLYKNVCTCAFEVDLCQC